MPTPAQIEARKPVDPDVFIPAAVRRAQEQADRFQTAFIEGGLEALPDGTLTVPIGAPPVDPNAPPVTPSETPPTTLPATPPVTPSATPPGNEEVAPDPNNAEAAAWYRRAMSYRGRFEQSQGFLNQAGARIAELERGQPSTVTPPAPPAEETDEEFARRAGVTEEQMEMWGPDMMGAIRKMATMVAAPLAQQVTATTRQVAITEQEKMWNLLDKEVPDWEPLNRDPIFLGWLSLPDPASGVRRKDLLVQAFEGNEGPRVAFIFKAFKTETGIRPATPAVPTTPVPPGTPPGTPPSNRVALQDLAAPGRPRASTPANGEADERALYTETQIAKFFHDKQKGVYRGREAEADALERDIFKATSEGRIVPG